MTQRQLKATIRSRTPLHEGFLRVYHYEFDVEQYGGGSRRTPREVMERGHAVAVLGHDPVRDEVVLGNEFRPGVLVVGEYPYRDNLVAGAIDDNESALQAAVREMKEESGLDLRNPVLIHPGAYVSSGGTSEKISIVYGTVDAGHAGGRPWQSGRARGHPDRGASGQGVHRARAQRRYQRSENARGGILVRGASRRR